MANFPVLSGEDETLPEDIESMCMECQENGTTRYLLTKIPFFKEVILSSFYCEHCGNRNNEIQPGASIQLRGVRYTVRVDNETMMSRQIVKQASASFHIKELEFEAPAFTSRGVLTTIEGLFETAVEGLQQNQPVRKVMEPELAAKIDSVIESLNEYKSGAVPFTLVIEDSSGNSFVENPLAPADDPKVTREEFNRSPEQNEKLGLAQAEEPKSVDELLEMHDEVEGVSEFPTNCEQCHGPAPTRMKLVEIPFFKEIILMSTTCDTCGFKSREVKSGGSIDTHGTRITLNMSDKIDLNRDVLVSESCEVSIPELDVACSLMSDSGKFSTLEGLLTLVVEHLGRINPFALGDSSTKVNTVNELRKTVEQIQLGKKFVKIILDDPLSNSFIQNIYAPDPDPEMAVERYERSEQQNEQYGLNDIKTENYS